MPFWNTGMVLFGIHAQNMLICSFSEYAFSEYLKWNGILEKKEKKVLLQNKFECSFSEYFSPEYS